MDLAIRNGTVITAGGRARTNIGVEHGRIVQVGGTVERAAREIDATDLYVFPGGVDPHVHLNTAGLSRPEQVADDLYHGTRAAAAGGVTTVLDFAYQQQGRGLRPAVEAALAEAQQRAVIDYSFHPVVYDPSDAALADLPALLAEGFLSFKIFTVTAGFEARVSEYLRFLQALGSRGALAVLHCEDRSIIDFCTGELLGAGNRGVAFYPRSRPREAEATATERALALARIAGVDAYVVHVSSNAALDATRRARMGGQRVFVETRPIYLYLTEDEYRRADGLGPLFVGQPPLRDTADVAALWHGLVAGDVQTVGTDHFGWRKEAKLDPTHTFATVPPGMPNLETLMPMLFSEGVRTGRVTEEQFVALIATNPARIFGLYPNKGTIAPGADADLVIWDPERTRVIRAEAMHSAAGYDVFEGRSVTGWPLITISRGEVVYEDGKASENAGRGRLAARERRLL